MLQTFLIPTLIILVPVLASISGLTRWYRHITVGASIIDAVMSLFLFKNVQASFYLVNNTTWIFSMMIILIYVLSALFSLEYISSANSGIPEGAYYSLMNIFVSTMLFTVLINNYGLMWIGIEATTISSALLLLSEKSQVALEVAWRYIILVSAGVAVAFISIILIYYSLGTLTVSIALESTGNAKVLALAVAIALVGFGTKVGVFPVHTWLPDAHSEAPAPISAMFSGILLPTALYVLYMLYRLHPLTELFLAFGLISVTFATAAMANQRSFKRLFAYSTMENMNIALIGLAIGGSGIIGAILLLVSHAFGKAGAFYSSGIISRKYNTKNIDDVAGAQGLRLTSTALILSSMAVTGAPPFANFIGEFLIITQLFKMGLTPEAVFLSMMIATAFITVNYHVTKMVFKGKKTLDEPKMMAVVAIISSLVPLVLGLVMVI
ncbi:MAG: hydrogenase 4 subunit F [Nitrososphaerota archaeon]|jgi:hydrogenase-4 component F|nr:hydrogenase 4 subunit F [Nitrososphaerota archaeon]MDG6927275.1 hydrogenase 4 subunit F [Nitrososphaerota archaeon]MDG6930367.1 hydrogenase 4 subunit F [Nitrososphaerota archaeon]MDG6931723.1 hydrogenase 4 subunit F [Nitrososphaerota archaeon]MDG6936771.1 hydrogenase 4 subunit F [Nitrososphaerota archaeon]